LVPLWSVTALDRLVVGASDALDSEERRGYQDLVRPFWMSLCQVDGETEIGVLGVMFESYFHQIVLLKTFVLTFWRDVYTRVQSQA